MAIKITSKDKSMLLLIATLAVFVWFLFAYGLDYMTSPSFENSQSAKIVNISAASKVKPYNLSRFLKKGDLKNKVILLSFIKDDCNECFSDIEKLKNIEKRFGNKIAIIGIHSSDKTSEYRQKLLKKLILRSGIDFAVIDDNEGKLQKEFAVKSFPRYILIDSKGRVVNEKSEISEIDDIVKITKKYRHNLNLNYLPISLERNSIVKNVLSFPSKIEYTSKFKYKSHNAKAFFVANSGLGNIMAFKEDGKIITQIGSKNAGYLDSDVARSKFRSPMGMVFRKDKLYVADSLNNTVREIDFKENKVSTLIGDSKKGESLGSNWVPASQVNLFHPTDIEFFPNSNHLVIANSGSDQLLQYSFKTKKIKALAAKGSYSDLSSYKGKLYFIDSSSGSLKVMDKKYNIKTLLKNDKDGDSKLNAPLGIFANQNGVYISDSKNNRIAKYQHSRKKLKILFGDKEAGDGLGDGTRFNQPDGIIIVKNDMFVVDVVNNRIVKIDFKSMRSRLIDVIPEMKLPNEGFLEYLPNLERLGMAKVKTDKTIPLNITFDKGWKINELGPSFLNLLEIVGKKSANLVATYDWSMIRDNIATLPKLQSDKKYIIQGTIYYCQDKRNALCYISSYEQEVVPSSKGKNVLNIEI